MKDNMLLKKICSIYANDMHFATIIFPYVREQLEKNTTIRTILEKDEVQYIEKILENIGLNSQIKEDIRKIDWKSSNINKIRRNFKLLEEDIKENKTVDVIISGGNVFIEKVNKAIDLWVKNNIEQIEKSRTKLNIINCFSFEENKNVDGIMDSHEYILKTAGLEEILGKEELLKAN